MRSTIILANPNAGRGRAGVLAQQLISGCESFSNTQLLQCADAVQARAQLDQLLTARCEHLIVVGGDGTLNLAAHAVLDKRLGHKIRFSLLPAGTGSDFARTLAQCPTVATLRQVPREPQSRPVDVLRVDWPDGQYRYGINTVSAGIAGAVNTAMTASPGHGSGAYLRATVKAFFHYRPGLCTLALNGQHWHHGDLTLLAITNGSHFGQGMRVAPRAAVDDGQAEVVAVTGMSRGWLLLRLVRIYLGNHLTAPYVRYCRAREITVEQTSGTLGLDIDGESAPGGRFTVRVIPGALRFSC
ncbi:MAG: hypothetical protein CL395_07535 [Acidiferrobacteraceae bacterium]|nr:hypothetical protein [Acidiferrobacteraceae bacterium]